MSDAARGSVADEDLSDEVSFAEELHCYETWREIARRNIDEGFDQCVRGELVDGDVVFDRLLRRLEAGR